MSDGFAYDVLDYPSHVYPQAHPSRLAAIGRLHGLDSASPRDCHLLEVGCGDGLQLLTLAMAYPRSHFVGVDLSKAAIARGVAMRDRLGLQNLALIAADLLTWDPGVRPYDYIVAHGFFSWVPEHVRVRLLQLCSDKLTDCGIAYISFNALPGCHLRRMVWEMMKFHVRQVADPSEKIANAREFLAWLGTHVLASKHGSYGVAIVHEVRELLERTDASVLFHDDLSDVNRPYSISEFVDQARMHGMEFLGEAEYHEINPAIAGPGAAERLAAVASADSVASDQYLDFLKGRRFRQTLLCRRDAPLQREPREQAVATMEAVAKLQSEPLERLEDGELPPTGAVRFATAEGAALVTTHPVAMMALAMIGAGFPAPVAVAQLHEHVGESALGVASTEHGAPVLAQTLIAGFQMGLLTLHCDAPRFAVTVGERPKTSALVQLQLSSGADLLTSLRPSMVALDSQLALELVRLLDGSRDRGAILNDLAERMAALPGPEGEGSEHLHSTQWWREQIAPKLEEGLLQVARMALLVDDDSNVAWA